MKKYMVYLDSGDNRGDVFKVIVPAENERDAIRWADGNGEIIAVKDVSDQYGICLTRVSEVLEKGGFTKMEVDLICRTLDRVGIAG